MKILGKLGSVSVAILMVVSTWGCQSGGTSVTRGSKPDPTSAVAARPSAVTPQFYSGGPQSIPMRSDSSYANDVVSIAKKENLNTHKPPTPIGPQGFNPNAY